ncbi:FAD-dependent oxidoreductase [Mesoterricola sediminis]|uniref:Oxidoreductase n=1 Tax=Mesoterricola sediminis TaxID=2927980 RepID=A0AA48H654_9BACT|nr:FAD-dependent oxidoreductase [Mesoterricola sediminis]BDU78091.1 oxidoreductase [Mesoterricola sediminis]
MEDRDGQSVSLWMEGPAPAPPVLAADLDTDVCVIGAGIAGLTTAYQLGRAGRAVTVLDEGLPGRRQTWRTTAHLASAVDDRFVELERLHGAEGARLAADSHASAIDHIGRIVVQERIPCGFRRLPGYLFLAPGGPPDLLDQELVAARRAGLEVDKVPRLPMAGFDPGACLRFARQGQLDPVAYMAGLAAGILRDGGHLWSGAHVIAVEGGDPARVRTATGPTVTARAVVVATNTPINDRYAIHTKQAPYRTYAISARIPPGALEAALYWDTGDPYHYVRLRGDGTGEDVLIVGGEDHKTGQQGDGTGPYDRLEAWARVRFPTLGPVDHRWSGQVLEPVDGLAYIGRNPLDAPNVYIATGDSGMGMTHGTIAGLLITDLIVGLPNPWAPLYDPARKTLRAASVFTRENANAALQFAAWVTPGEVPGEEVIPPGEGAVVRRGLSKVAVYRDPEGSAHACSAVCPHLGGIVAWNPGEHTWDCPCHGSRFSALGEVLNGPALSGLAPAPLR